PVGPLSPGVLSSQLEAPGLPSPMPSSLPQRTMSSGVRPELRLLDRGVGASLDLEVLDMVEFERPMRAIYQIGTVEVVLTAPYASTERVPQRAVDVWLNMNE